MPTVQDAPVADYEAEEVLVLSEREQLRALADDLRSQIVARLRHRARSTQELSAELRVPKGTVGHHLKVLERAGLIRVVRTRQVRALTEKYYGRVARLFVFKAEDPADARALGAATLRRAAEEVERAPEGASFALVRARLTGGDAKRFERRIKRLVDDFRDRDTAGAPEYALAYGLWAIENETSARS